MSEQLAPESASALPPTAPREHGWRGVVLAVLAFIAVPLMGPVRLAAPVEQTLILLVPAIAVCTLVGWWAGGRLSLAVIWCALAAWMLMQPVSLDAAYGNLARGWALVLATSFGIVSLAAPKLRLFPRALGAVALALAGGIVMLLIASTTGDSVVELLRAQYARRVADSMTFTGTADWQRMAAEHSDLSDAIKVAGERMLTWIDPAVLLAPAFLALQSLLTLALAWSVYHRVARVRLGLPLSPLKEFRFNDQLVWGVIVGIVSALFPALADLRSFGLNLLLFFGALYALRGLGVLAFLLPGRFATAMLISATLLFPLVGAFALGLGLGDTWLDWRSRARPTTN